MAVASMPLSLAGFLLSEPIMAPFRPEERLAETAVGYLLISSGAP